jgi:hypothetical protein
MKRQRCFIGVWFAAVSIFGTALASNGFGVSGGLILTHDPSARGMALAGAIGSMADEVSAFAYNPAALSSLKTGQASLHYEKGLTDDTFNQLLVGMPLSFGSMALELTRYDGGSFDYSDGVTQKNVKAQEDRFISLGYSKIVKGYSIGVAGKYYSSELIQKVSAHAYALDLGVAKEISAKLRLSGSIQNMGTRVKYAENGDNLPRIARMGMSYVLKTGVGRTVGFAEIPYFLNEQKPEAALGTETFIGSMVLRWGYRTGYKLGGLTLGTGFTHGKMSLDYAFGLIQDLNAQHRFSFSVKFGGVEDGQKQ